MQKRGCLKRRWPFSLEAAHYFVDGMEEILAKGLPPFETIEALVDLHIEAVEEAPTTVTVFTDEWKHLPEVVLEEFLQMRRGYELHWRNILKDGIDSGTVRPVNTQLMAQTLLSTMRWVQTWVDDEKVKKLNDIKAELKSFIINGLKQSEKEED